MKILSITALVFLLLTVISCGGCGSAQAQAMPIIKVDPNRLTTGDFEREEIKNLLSACRLGHYEHAYELDLSFRWSTLEPKDIGTTQEEIEAYLKLGKIRELVPAMNRIRAGQASSDGATWVARQLKQHSLQPVDIGTSWNELRELGAVN